MPLCPEQLRILIIDQSKGSPKKVCQVDDFSNEVEK
jgi:hypothetical protein